MCTKRHAPFSRPTSSCYEDGVIERCSSCAMSLTMSKLTDEPPSYTRIAHLTSTGDGRDRKRLGQPVPQSLTWDDVAVSDDEEEDDDAAYGYGHAPAEQVPYSNIQEIIPGLFIGDVTAAMDHELLKSKNITVIIAASGFSKHLDVYLF